MWLCQHGTHMALMGKEHGLITPHDLLVLSAFLRRELSGMIHWRTIKNPSNPQHPIHSLRKTHQEVLTHWYWWNMDLSMENNDVYLYSMVYPKLIGLNLHITWGSSFDGFPTTLPWKSIREVAEMRRTSAQSSWWHLHRIPVSHISSSDGIITYKLYIYMIYIYIYPLYMYILYIYYPQSTPIYLMIFIISTIFPGGFLPSAASKPTEASRGSGCRPAGRTRRWRGRGSVRPGVEKKKKWGVYVDLLLLVYCNGHRNDSIYWHLTLFLITMS